MLIGFKILATSEDPKTAVKIEIETEGDEAYQESLLDELHAVLDRHQMKHATVMG